MTTCPTCGATNADGARSCTSCGEALGRTCGACGAELPKGARFCPACGTPSTEPSSATDERKLVTVLFADVTGSTELGERLDPERLREVMAAYFGAMRTEIEAEGGTVEKFIGDAVMAAFGVPTAHEDDPSRALRAALRMQDRLPRLNADLVATHGVELQIRIGVNTGEVLATLAAAPGEPMVTGDVVNVAARLQAAADPGEILVADRTARAVRGFAFRPTDARELKGKELPFAASTLVGSAGRVERGVAGLHAPMVGRDDELAVLLSVLRRSANEGRANLVTIYGDPGVGKSRLTAEFVATAEREGATILRGRCVPYGDGITYWPLAEILKGHAGVLDTDPPQLTLEKIRKAGRELITTDVSADPARATAALAYTVGVDDPEVPFSSLEPRQVRQELHLAWRSFFSALASPGPLVTVIEDIHWADPALLDLLEEMADRVVGSALFLCPARPELTATRPGWGGGRRNHSSIALDPLPPEDAERLVRMLLTIDDLSESVRGRILMHAEGNPFFIEEIIRQLIDQGHIVRSDGRWRAGGTIEEVDLPDSIQGVLAARIDLLDPPTKRLLQAAAVVGRVFWPGPLEILTKADERTIADTLRTLEERELVLARLGSSIGGEPEYIFKHVLTRDVAYASLPRRDRSSAHAAVAGWIERTAGDRASEVRQLLAHHLVAAYMEARGSAAGSEAERLRGPAFRTLLDASEDARRRFAIQKARDLADRALAIAVTPMERSLALERHGLIAINDYRGDDAWNSYREACELRLEHAPEERIAIARLCGRAVEAPTRWPGSMTIVVPEREVTHYIAVGFDHLPDGDSEERTRLLIARASIPFAVGGRRTLTTDELREAEESGLEAVEMALRIGQPNLASAALDMAGSVLISAGDYGRSQELSGRRIGLVAGLTRDVDDPWEVGDAHAMHAWNLSFIGRYRDAAQIAREGMARTEDALRIGCLSWLGLAEFFLGRWDAVIEEVQPWVERLLGDRAEEPPYFTIPTFGPTAFILTARGAPTAERYVDILRRSAAGVQGYSVGNLESWQVLIEAYRGNVGSAASLLTTIGDDSWGGSRPLRAQVRAFALAELGLWDDVASFLDTHRAYARDAGLLALPTHLDRLEGRAALAADDPARAVELLTAASAAFGRLEARWERACTDLWLTEGLLATGRDDEARTRLAAASTDVEELGSLKEIARARELGTTL